MLPSFLHRMVRFVVTMATMWLLTSPRGCVVEGLCPSDTLTVYEVHLETLWDRRDFPKQYPQWRPPASWSKTVGYSHDGTFHMFEKGQVASPALKKFAEEGDEELFQNRGQGSSGVLDSFVMPSIIQGVGEEKTIVILDGNRSKLSLVTKILPSPDWFIGINSHDLCPDGEWTEFVHMELVPMDAGTDSGLTFTSPNWETSPAGRIRLISAHYPDHPASSFYYPDRESLPTLAQITIRKKREYSLKPSNMAADQATLFMGDKTHIYKYELQKTKNGASEIKKVRGKRINILKNEIETTSEDEKNQKENSVSNFVHDPNSNDIFRQPTLSSKANSYKKPYKHSYTDKWLKAQKSQKKIEKQQTSTSVASNSTTVEYEPGLDNWMRNKSETINESHPRPEEEEVTNEIIFENKVPDDVYRLRSIATNRVEKKKRKKIPKGNAMAVIDDIVRNYQKENRRKFRKRRREERRRRRDQAKNKPPRDCRVSPWSDWSPCSKTCGIGEQSRKRHVTKHARRGGKQCPLLEETTWCGSARACNRTDYFSWSS